MIGQIAGGTRAADREEFHVDPFRHVFLPVFREDLERAVRQIDHPFGDGNHRHSFRNQFEHVVQEPIDAEARHPADNQFRTVQRFFNLIDGVIFDPFVQGPVQIDVIVVFAQSGDYIAVQRCPDQADFIPIFKQRKRQCRSHLACAD